MSENGRLKTDAQRRVFAIIAGATMPVSEREIEATGFEAHRPCRTLLRKGYIEPVEWLGREQGFTYRPTLDGIAAAEPKTVPNDEFRERFEKMAKAHQIDACELSYRMGWAGEGQRAKRMLGLAKEWDSNTGTRRIRRRLQLGTAKRLAAALEMDPWEAGL